MLLFCADRNERVIGSRKIIETDEANHRPKTLADMIKVSDGKPSSRSSWPIIGAVYSRRSPGRNRATFASNNRSMF
jgi:hypothetical protein